MNATFLPRSITHHYFYETAETQAPGGLRDLGVISLADGGLFVPEEGLKKRHFWVILRDLVPLIEALYPPGRTTRIGLLCASC